MNKQIKLLAVLALFLVSLMSVNAISAVIKSDTVDNVDIVRIDVDETEISENDINSAITNDTPIPLGPFFAGERVNVKVFWRADDNIINDFDMRINVELDDEDLETDFFTVREGWSDTASFVLRIPSDIDEDTYTLNIELEDDFGNKEIFDKIKLDIVNKKHLVEIFDVNFPQSLEVKAGQTFLASVGVRNLGHEEEEDIKISVSVPDLGLFQRSRAFDLLTEEQEDVPNDDDDEWKLYKDLFLVVPSNTVSGVYDLVVKVSFDDGDKSEEQVFSLVVGEGVAPGNALVSINTESQTFAQGSGAVYTVIFPASENYNIVVEGISDWGTSIVNMDRGQAQVFVSANEDAASGSYPFTVKVMAGSSVVEEFDLTANVTAFQSSSADIKEGLQIGFAVLLVILIILGIILAAKKIGKSDNYEDSLMDEGETYY